MSYLDGLVEFVWMKDSAAEQSDRDAEGCKIPD